MASLARPSFLRQQVRVAAPCTRFFQSQASPFRTSGFASRTTPVKIPFQHDAAIRVAAFHATSRRPILPPLPQVVQGTANDAAKVPESSPSHGAYHWTFERLVSAVLIPVTIAPFAAGTMNPVLDATLCALIVVHSHIGFQSIIIDYVPLRRVPRARKLFEWGLRAGSLVVAAGLYEYETNDVGLTEGIKALWHA